MNSKTLIFLILTIVFLIGGCTQPSTPTENKTNAAKNNETEKNLTLKITIDPRIYEEYKNSTEITVYVEMYPSDYLNNKTLVNEVLYSIPNFKVTFRYIEFPGFEGNVTQEDFNKLRKDPRVKMILLGKIQVASEQRNKSVAKLALYGDIRPADRSMEIILIQNGSIVQRTKPNVWGSYSSYRFDELRKGRYGILIYYMGDIYMPTYKQFAQRYSDTGEIDLNKIENIEVNYTKKFDVLEIGRPQFNAGRIQIQFNQNIPKEELNEFLEECDCRIIRNWTYYSINVTEHWISVPENQTELKMILKLRNDPRIIMAHPIFILYPGNEEN